MKIYGTIEKTEELDDGTIKVFGFASSEAVDSDGETVTAEAMKAAIPDYMKWGAVREMHDKKAAGTAIEADVKDDGRTWFGAHVVDSEAVKKVKAGVYKGFSIGGKVKSRDTANKSVITGIDLIEVSLVDRPANPEAVFTMYKSESLEPESVQKSLYNVGEFAGLLHGLGWVVCNANYESENSTIPVELREWLQAGIEIMGRMAAEDGAKLINELREMRGEPEVLEMAASAEVEKAGAKFSKVTREQLASLHEMVKRCDEHLGKMDYAGEADKSSDADDLQKAANADDLIEKATKPLLTEIDALNKRIKELESQPEAPKAVLHVVEKSQSGDDSQKFEVKDAGGGINEAASIIKMIHCGKL
jgi:hypothetical protein